MLNQNRKRFFFILIATTLLTLGGAGCKSTAHGVGQDMEKAGEKIQEKTK